MRRPGIGEAVGSLLCLTAVLATLVVIDTRVRDRFEALVDEASAEPLVTWEERASNLRDAVIDAARDHSIDQAPLLVFTCVSTALLIFMLRT